jgi:hypothetical protein
MVNSASSILRRGGSAFAERDEARVKGRRSEGMALGRSKVLRMERLWGIVVAGAGCGIVSFCLFVRLV